MSRARKLAFTLLATGLGLGLLEGGAWLIERAVPAEARTLPLPTPGCPPPCLEGAAPTPAHEAGLHEEARWEGWRFAPNGHTMQGGVSCRTNRLGLRGPDPTPRVEGELRLLSVGDSSVFGYGVEEEDIFLNVAAAQLEATAQRPVTPITGAIPGLTSRQSLLLLEDLGAELDPDWVVVGAIWSDLYHVEGQSLAPAPLRSALYRVTLRMLSPYLAPRRIGWLEPDEGQPGQGRSARSSLLDYQRNLHALVDATEALGARPAFLLLPAPVDLEERGAPDWIEDYRAAMRGVAEERAAPLVEGPQMLRASGLGAEGFFDNVHPSVPTHEALGLALADALEEAGG